MNIKDHWEQVYKTRSSDRVGWYKSHLQTSLDWIKELGLTMDSPIIDVGGGASNLVDDLLGYGYKTISVLDISEEALSLVKERLGNNKDLVTWLTGDVTTFDFQQNYYELWHDRAVFHFLTTHDQQQKYRASLIKGLRSGGHLIIGTFALEAPPMCSGLPIQRYSVEQLENTLGKGFELKHHHKEMHITPGGVGQMYLYCHFCKTS